MHHVDRGRLAEAMAASYLELRGYRILERNFRFGRLEIDLIAARENLVAVVEVKYRASPRRGPASGAVHPGKQRSLETAAVGYLKRQGWTGRTVRFDVVTLDPWSGGRGALTIRHLPGAFPATGRYRG